MGTGRLDVFVYFNYDGGGHAIALTSMLSARSSHAM
jgi:hypothetical protein